MLVRGQQESHSSCPSKPPKKGYLHGISGSDMSSYIVQLDNGLQKGCRVDVENKWGRAR